MHVLHLPIAVVRCHRFSEDMRSLGQPRYRAALRRLRGEGTTSSQTSASVLSTSTGRGSRACTDQAVRRVVTYLPVRRSADSVGSRP